MEVIDLSLVFSAGLESSQSEFGYKSYARVKTVQDYTKISFGCALNLFLHQTMIKSKAAIVLKD